MNTEKIARFSNFEIIRIIAIFFILISHYAQHGLLPAIENKGMIVQFLTMYWHALGAIGVALFLLLTGYFMIDSDFKIRHFFRIVIETIFYSWGFYLLFNFFSNYDTSVVYYKSVFPILTSHYWFVTLYLILYLLIPVFNKLFNSLDKQTLSKYLLLCIIMWFVIPNLNDAINLQKSYFVNFICIYFVGAYIKRYGISFFDKWQNALLTIILSEATIGVYQLAFVLKQDFNEYMFMRIAWCDSVFILLTAISIFSLLKNFKLNYNKIINFFASSALSAYLITENMYVRKIIWKRIFQCNYSHGLLYTVSNMIFAVTLSFIICVLIDKVRIKVYCQKLEEFAVKQYNRIILLLSRMK